MAATKTAPLLTSRQVAEVLGLTQETVLLHTRQGRHDSFVMNLGGQGRSAVYRYDPAGLDRWLQSRRLTA